MNAQPLTMADSPLGAATLVKSVYDAGDADQYKRELVANSVEAGATEIIVTAFRMPDIPDGGVKAAFVDNGRGIGANKIMDYLGTLFSGASEYRDGNFQMGARVSTLPWNPEGVLVASWTDGDDEGAMIHMVYNDEKKYYELELFGDEQTPVGVPRPEYKHPLIERDGRGTVFLLLGSAPEDHTVGDITRPPDGKFAYGHARNKRTDWHYYNGKFWALPDDVTLKFLWGGPENLDEWSTIMKPGTFFEAVPARMPFRSYKGLNKIIADSAESRGSVPVVSRHGYRARVHWALFPEEKIVRKTAAGGAPTDTDDYGIGLGFFGELYRGKKYHEVYNMHYRRRQNAQFKLEYYGISRKELRDRMVVVVEPDARETADYIGVSASPSRDALRVGGKPLPHEEWGEKFARDLPQEIRDRIKVLDGEDDADLMSRLKRLQKKITTTFSRKVSRSAGSDSAPIGTPDASKEGLSGGGNTGLSGPTDEQHEHNPPHGNSEPSIPSPSPKPKKREYAAGGKHNLDAPSGDAATSLLDINPCWNSDGSEFTDEETEGLLARWLPTSRTVYVNGAHPYLTELIRSEKAARKRSKADEVEKLVQNAILMHLVGHIASSEAFSRSSMASSNTRSLRYRQDAVSNAALSGTLTNVATIESVVTNAFKGRTGLGRITDDIA